MISKKCEIFAIRTKFFLTDFSSSLKQSEILREFIFCGPTNLPVLYDTKFLLPTHEKRRKQKEIEKAYDSVKTSYMRNVVEPWNNDRFFRMDKNLWIYFLTEPKMVLECIKEVQKKAAEKGTTSFKAMNITLHRPNWTSLEFSFLQFIFISIFEFFPIEIELSCKSTVLLFEMETQNIFWNTVGRK